MVSRPRAQVLLTTAVVMATVLLATAIVLTAVTTTDVRSPDDPTTDGLEADRLATDIARTSAELAGAVNADGPYSDAAVLAVALNDTFANLTDRLYETVGDRRGTIVDLSTPVIDTEGAAVTDSDLDTGLETGDAAVGTDPSATAAIAGLQVGVTASSVTNGAATSLQVRIYGDGDARAVAIYRDDGSVALEATAFDPGGSPTFDGNPDRYCGDDGTLTVDLGQRSQPVADCRIDAFDGLDPVDGEGYGLVFHQPDAVDGGYHYVTDRPAEHFTDGGFDAEASSGAFATPVAWALTVEYTQHARASELTTTRTIPVYEQSVAVELLEVPWS